MKIKKLVMTVLVLLSVQMCGPEPKLDYSVTKSESYKISEKKMKKNSLEVKKGFEADNDKFRNKAKEVTKKFIEDMMAKEFQNKNETFATQAMKQMVVNMIEKGIEYQKSKIEEIRFFNDEEVQITQKVKVFDNSKGNIAKLQNEYELLKLVAQKLQYKDIQDMTSQMEKMGKKEAFSKFMNGISGVIEDEFKKEENYTEMTTTVNMNKVNNTWHIKNLDEQIKALETIFSNLANSM
ncbi:hypothetical protein [Leptotrichia massiliensis]|uniref:hypothetical protein n=1 Tax=Leptotrichia massiliensis TaxID=1852388 RepID=UPI0028CFFB35|nr:hypothetical protein [Leptotrichia massiliensis]